MRSLMLALLQSSFVPCVLILTLRKPADMPCLSQMVGAETLGRHVF